MSDNHNAILWDWLSFTSISDGVEDLKAMLGLSHVDWIEMNSAFNGYLHRIYFNGISICWGVPASWGNSSLGNYHKDTTYVNMSGAGCRAYETHSTNCDWDSLFALLVSCEDYHISRLDVAYDDFDGVLNLAVIRSECFHRDHMITTFRRGCVEQGILNAIDENTVYFGSKKSNLMFRIYNKAAERNRSDEIPHWVRFEIQMRDDRAILFIKKYIEYCYNIGEVFKGVVYNYLRFVTPKEGDTNNRRWNLQEWYSNFIGEVEKIKLFEKKDEEYNVFKLKQSVVKKFGASTTTYMRIAGVNLGISTVMKEIVKESSKNNPKYNLLMAEQKAIDNLMSEEDLIKKLDNLDTFERMGILEADLSDFEKLCDSCDDISSVLSRLPDLYKPTGGDSIDTLASP